MPHTCQTPGDPLRFQRLLEDLKAAHQRALETSADTTGRKFPTHMWVQGPDVAFASSVQVQLELLVEDVFGRAQAAQLREFLDRRQGAAPATTTAAAGAAA